MTDQPYRSWVQTDLQTFRVLIEESDILVSAKTILRTEAENALLSVRSDLKSYIARDPTFETTLVPHNLLPNAPVIIQDMAKAARACGVGPMAAVAGAVAEYVGRALLVDSSQVIVENGGDVFISTIKPRVVAIYAGKSPHSGKVGVRVSRIEAPFGICTSSGTVGPSLSFGIADAALILAESAILADAAASFLGNQIHSQSDIEPALQSLNTITGVWGGVVVLGEHLGAWGEIELVQIVS
jgi:uncharacterized protein